MTLKKPTKAEAKVPEETPAPEPETVRLVAPPGVTMDGWSGYPGGVRVLWRDGIAVVDPGIAAVVTRWESGVTVEPV